MKKFSRVAVGGTFDELHRGHKVLLAKAFEVGEFVAIGLTSDELVSRLSKPHVTASYQERLKGLQKYLAALGLSDRAQVIPLFTAFGSSTQDPQLQAIIVSAETQPTAQKINQQRKKNALPPLEIIAVNMVPSQNSHPISTTRIRKGEIDHEGHLLQNKP
ncbi:MAG: phosphopantetheine adenylyltransferase [Candidatus Bathyarchaeota archaeon]|nr:phosphopantetheine adenylyltransferase [Candidatus Bathyarchaeota archaeon]